MFQRVIQKNLSDLIAYSSIMFKRIVLKLSLFLYKGHLLIEQYFKNKSSKQKENFLPYILKYKPQNSSKEINKIIHINGNFIVGGTSQLIVDIIEHTSDKYNHVVIVPNIPNPLPYQPISLYEYSLEQAKEMYDFLKEQNPSLVHIHYWVRHPQRYDMISFWYKTVFDICLELGLKVIQNVNVPTEPYSNASVCHNVFVSNYVLDNFNFSNTKSSVIYPGSDFSHFKNNNLEELSSKCVGMVYRLDPDKLNAESIEVFILIAKKRPDVKCYIIGGGYYLEYYKIRVSSEGLNDNFVFTNAVSYKSLPEYYKRIGIFIAPVHDESFGQVTPFAMSMGLCVAGYNIGALKEILNYDDTLAEYGNIDRLVAIVISLLDDSDKREKLGIKNQKRAHEKFSINSMISQYEELYQRYLV